MMTRAAPRPAADRAARRRRRPSGWSRRCRADTVEITSSFDGEALSLFGNIEARRRTPTRSRPGPTTSSSSSPGRTQNRVARSKTNNFGIWLNTDQVGFEHFPSFYHGAVERPARATSPIRQR